MGALDHFLPGDGVGGAQNAAFPIGADEGAAAVDTSQGRVLIDGPGPFLAIRGGESRTRSDGDEAAIGKDNRIEMFALDASLRLRPIHSIASACAQTVESNTDKYAVAKRDVHQGINGLGIRRIFPVQAIRRNTAPIAIAHTDKEAVAEGQPAQEPPAGDAPG